MMKNGVYFILIALLVAELFRFRFMQIRRLLTSQWTQNNAKSQKMEYL